MYLWGISFYFVDKNYPHPLTRTREKAGYFLASVFGYLMLLT